jgi:hypothetical protein
MILIFRNHRMVSRGIIVANIGSLAMVLMDMIFRNHRMGADISVCQLQTTTKKIEYCLLSFPLNNL